MLTPLPEQGVHGGQVHAYAQALGLQPSDLLDFSANINPVIPQVDWAKITQATANSIANYPPHRPSDDPLTALLAQRFGLPVEYVQLCPAISLTLHLLFAALRPQHTVLFTPIYGEYWQAAKRYSTHLIDYSVPANQWCPIQHPIPKHALVVMVNPSTPQGQFIAPQAWQALFAAVQASEAWLLVDEAFLPFIGLAPHLSARQWIGHYSRLIVLQSLTKFYACPGVRLGALFCQKPLAALNAIPWPLSTFDRLWMIEALQDSTHAAHSWAQLAAARAAFLPQLAALPWVKQILPGAVNFVLLELSRPAEKVAQTLLTQRILTRPVHSFGLSPYHLRLAIKSTATNQQLLQSCQTLESDLCSL